MTKIAHWQPICTHRMLPESNVSDYIADSVNALSKYRAHGAPRFGTLVNVVTYNLFVDIVYNLN